MNFGVCNVCRNSFQPKVKNGKVVGMKYYCSDECYKIPIFKSLCKYCNNEIIISGEELRQRRGNLRIVCNKLDCLQKSKREAYENRNFDEIYQKSLKEKRCKLCDKPFIGVSLSLYCKECAYKITHRNCVKCGDEFEVRPDSNVKVCEKCIIGEKSRYVGYCDDEVFNNCQFKENCSRYFYYGSPQNKNCKIANKCIHKKNILYCQECSSRGKVQLYNKLLKLEHNVVDNLIVIKFKDYKESYKKSYARKCKVCDREFRGDGPTTNWCRHCYYILKCKGCGNSFVSTDKDTLVCGQECSGIYFHKQGCSTNIFKAEKKNINDSIVKINLNSHTKITDKNIDSFKGISGVWFKLSDGIVLDVCITKDIKSEVEYHNWAIKNKVNPKYLKMSKYNNIELYYLGPFDSWEGGLIKECEFAIKSNAIYWSPAPGIQMSRYKELRKNNNKDI